MDPKPQGIQLMAWLLLKFSPCHQCPEVISRRRIELTIFQEFFEYGERRLMRQQALKSQLAVFLMLRYVATMVICSPPDLVNRS